MPSIVVHEKALAHLSRGLYRSPGSALRELVSNAWDANATVVTINTNYPWFMQLAVKDNGDGFDRNSFARLMGGGVGNSDKQPNKELKYGRPVIGRLGIGLLGIAQMCGTFTVSSRPRVGTAFKARVRLYDLLRPSLDKNDPSVVAHDGYVRTVDVGEYEFQDPEEQAYGTVITSGDVHPTFIDSFRASLELPDTQEPPLEWCEALNIFRSVRSLHQLGDYWKLIWELAATSPVPYVDDEAVPEGAVSEAHSRLGAHKFAVRIDGLAVNKPVHLAGNPNGYTIENVRRESISVYGRRVTFDGYIAVQEGKQLNPDELRGIMVRIRNVGVGYYDPSFLDYPLNQGPREKWLTGEIYVEEGLDDALNVDRDSFNKFHPEYRALQRRVHEILDGVFSRVYKQIDVRSARRVASRKEAQRECLLEALGGASDSHDVRVISRERHPEKDGDLISIMRRENGELEIALADPDQVGVRKVNRELALAILAIYEVASLEESAEARDRRFRRLLMKLLKRW